MGWNIRGPTSVTVSQFTLQKSHFYPATVPIRADNESTGIHQTGVLSDPETVDSSDEANFDPKQSNTQFKDAVSLTRIALRRILPDEEGGERAAPV